jgi:hypothetical protein
MRKQAPIVLECPECGEKFITWPTDDNQPSEKTTIYSNGFFMSQDYIRTPLIIGCVTCELGFFPEKGKVVAQPDWDEYEKTWKQLKSASPPTAGALALELRVRKNMELKSEIDLRREFWYAGLHSEAGQLLLLKNEKFKAFWNNSLQKLETLLSTELPEELLLKAEINRQNSNFEQCIQLLNNSKQKRSTQIIEAALAKNSSHFQFS